MRPGGRDGVLHVITSTDRRGAEVFAWQLAGALEARGTRGRVVALAPGATTGGLPVETLGSRRLGAPTLRALRAAVRDASVVVAHGSTTLPAVAVAGAGTGVSFVYRAIGDPAFWSARIDRRVWVRLALHRAAAVVSLWEAAALELRRRHRLDAHRVRVIPNGVAGTRLLEISAADRGPARRALGLEAHGAVVAYVGALSAEKDVGAAVRAVATLPDVALVVAGDGPEAGALRAEADRLAPARVRFLGAVDDVVPVLAAADALVLPSRTEGIPAVVIEAGLAGLPVVATAVGGIPEVVVDGETGVLVTPGDEVGLAEAISRALGEAGTLGPAGRARCRQRFELTPVAAAWGALLDEVVAPGGWWPPSRQRR